MSCWTSTRMPHTLAVSTRFASSAIFGANRSTDAVLTLPGTASTAPHHWLNCIWVAATVLLKNNCALVRRSRLVAYGTISSGRGVAITRSGFVFANASIDADTGHPKLSAKLAAFRLSESVTPTSSTLAPLCRRVIMFEASVNGCECASPAKATLRGYMVAYRSEEHTSELQ